MKPIHYISAISLAMALAGAGQALAAGDCLDCHADKAKVSAKNFIDREKFSHTEHSRLASPNGGCLTCHDGVRSGHPTDGIAVPVTTRCQDCHGDVQEEYAKSVHLRHAACGDCHNPHTAHGPTEVSGHEMNRMCAKCHSSAAMTKLHAKWLPQADLHIAELPCVTCHTSSKNYVITMYLVNRENNSRYGEFKLASYAELSKMAAGKDIRSLIDANGDNSISLDELREFNRSQASDTLRLQGMMIPESVTHNFQVLENRWDCSFCHGAGPNITQTSYLSFPDENGQLQRLPVEKGAVLAAIYGTKDFYMMGSSRNTTLNVIGLMIVAGGMIMPVGHGTLRFLTRKNRQHNDHH